MINHTELRPGNILLTETGTPVPIQAAGILAIEQGRLKMSPIPLTPEWLERCGFVDSAGNGIYRMNINIIDELCWYTLDKFMHYQTQGYGFERVLQSVKCVHQLQNFYLPMTGMELTIKEIQRT